MSIELTIVADSPADLKQQLRDLLGEAETASPPASAPKARATTTAAKPTSTGPTSAPPAASADTTPPSAPSPEPSATSPPTPSEATTTEAAGGAEPASPSEGGYDYDADIKPAVLRVSQKHGRAGVEKLLAPFNVTNARQVPTERYAEFMAAINKMLED